jgi:hypothetical protein
MSSPSPDRAVRLLLFAGWGFALASLVNPEKPPYSVFAIVAGALLVGAGLMLGANGGRAMERLSGRYAPGQKVPPYRWICAALIAAGVGWAGMGISLTVG